MPARNSTRPAKPYPDFPLFPHATGYWAKKIRGRMVYFGPWSDPDGAHQKYLEQKDALHSGLTPAYTQGLTLDTLCKAFITSKEQLVRNGELSPRSLVDYVATCKLLLKTFGRSRLVADLRPDDFAKLRAKMAKRWGLSRLGNEITRVRVVMNYVHKAGLADRAVVCGVDFRRPSKRAMRTHKNARGPMTFMAEEIRRMIDAAKGPLRAMILLGINCGFGNNDCGRLPLSALDLDGAWLSYPRPKTAIKRRVPLWPETVAALRDWLKRRPAPMSSHADLVFVTRAGDTWAKADNDNPVSKECRKLLDKLDINGHRGFYGLRHTFQNVGDGSRDFLAVRSIMGHASDADIADNYREAVGDDRLLEVVRHVRRWLFGVE